MVLCYFFFFIQDCSDQYCVTFKPSFPFFSPQGALPYVRITQPYSDELKNRHVTLQPVKCGKSSTCHFQEET